MEPNDNTGPATSTPLSGLKQGKLKAAQVRLFYAQSAIGTVGALLGAVILGGALWKVASHDRIIAWLVAYFALFLGRYCLIHSFHRQDRDDDDVIRWGKWNGLVVNAGGLLWGVASVLLFPQDSILHQFLLLIFVSGIAAAGAVIYSPTRDYVANMLLTLIPLSGRFIYELDEFHLTIGCVILLFAGALLLTGRKMHVVYADSLRLRYDKEELVENLKHEIVRRDRLEAELKTARDDLEIRVEARTAELKSLNRTLEQEIDERKQGEIKLRDALAEGQRFREALDHVSAYIYMKDRQSRYVYANRLTLELFGCSAEELVGCDDTRFFPPDTVKWLRELDTRVFVGEQTAQEIDVADTENGRRVYWEVKTPIYAEDECKTIWGLLGISTDITERKRTEEALRLSEERYRAVFDNAGIGINLLNRDGKILQVNRALLEMLGYAEEELRQLAFMDITHPEEREISKRHLEALMAGEIESYRLEKRCLRKDGSIFWGDLSTSAIRGANGDHLGTIGVISDITERKRAAEKSREVGAFLDTLLNAIPAPVFYKDADGRYIGFNKSYEEFYGKTQQDLVGKSVFDIAPRELAEVYHAKDLELFRNPGIQVYDSQVKDARGAIHDVVFHKSTFSDPEGRVLGLIGVILDITERKRADDERETLRTQLFQAQKMEAVGTLTGGIAHDFNNLLTIINGYTEMLLVEKTERDPEYEDLQKILQTGKKGAELVQRLLALSKKGESNPEPLDLNGTVQNASNLMERTFPKMIEIETILEKDLGKVNADDAQVEQVVMNLCINARDAMPEGGQIRIETRNTLVDEDFCRMSHSAKAGRHVLITISDTGNGMSKETMERMFDPFFTTKGWDFKKGTGLGLSVAKGIVEQHGGWITCESEQGKGTTFRLYFPVIEDPTAIQKPEPQSETVPKGEKILLVDDEELVRELGKRILERSGYTVITASNGREALEIYAREQSNIGVVVLDLFMPQMGGEKCLEELLRLNPRVKVVVSSGHSLSPKERACLCTHAKGFVDKPYQMKQFLEVVRSVLDAE